MENKMFVCLKVVQVDDFGRQSQGGLVHEIQDVTPIAKAWFAIRNTYHDVKDTMSIRLASDLGAVTCAVLIGAGMFGVVG